MDLQTAKKISDLYFKVNEIEFLRENIEMDAHCFCKRAKLTDDAEKLIIEIACTDINRQLEEYMKKLNSIKIENESEVIKWTIEI